jgi:hypothetical protein
MQRLHLKCEICRLPSSAARREAHRGYAESAASHDFPRQESACGGGVVTNVPSSRCVQSLLDESDATTRSIPPAPKTSALRRSWAVASAPRFGRPLLFGSHPRGHHRFDVGQCDQATPAQTIPGCHPGRVDASPRIRVRRVHHSGSGVLSVR